MPAVARVHESDPRKELADKIGDVSDIELFNKQVLVAVYIAPEETKGGIIIPKIVQEEDRYQGKVGLILKVGPDAFNDPTGKWRWAEDLGVGDWVFFKPSDGWAVTLNSQRDNLGRILDDIDVRGRIQHPDQVW